MQRSLDIHSTTCPVKALTTYAEVRPSYPGPFFCHYDGSPLTRYQFNAVLKKVLQFANLDGERISGHSFRIGAASVAYGTGVPPEEIRAMGRWRSNAFSSYVRPVPICSNIVDV